MTKYIVNKGIFIGHKFNGEVSFDGKTVWDKDSYGRGYPIENCDEMEDDVVYKEMFENKIKEKQ